MKNKVLLRWAAAAVFVTGCFLLVKDKIIPRKDSSNYNFIIIVSDALRCDFLGCYGGDARTPNIDWIAKQGVVFENAYSTAPFTRPAAVSMFTGSYARTYFVGNKVKEKDNPYKISFYVSDKEMLLAEVLKENGYDVKMDMENAIAKQSNNLQGFELLNNTAQQKEEALYLFQNFAGIETAKNIAVDLMNKESKRSYDYLYYLLTVPEERNFFLLKWFLDPHSPYDPPGIYKKRIPGGAQGLPRPESFYSTSTVKVLRQLKKEKKISHDEISYLKALYKAEVEYMDERVGYIIKALRQRGLLEKTFILFTADHGECFGEHGLVGHGHNFFETLVQIPLIITGPGIPAGLRVKTVVSSIDLMPTLKDLLEVKYASGMQGKSFSSVLHGNTQQDHIPYFDVRSNKFVYWRDNDALIMDGYKLIVGGKNDVKTFKLYNLRVDPEELNDISRDNPAIVKKMFKVIVDLRKINQRRITQNAAKIDGNVDLNKKWEQTLKLLKGMGYLE